VYVPPHGFGFDIGWIPMRLSLTYETHIQYPDYSMYFIGVCRWRGNIYLEIFLSKDWNICTMVHDEERMSKFIIPGFIHIK
jgi:hypothetical protein